MAAIIRVKRKRDDDPAEALLLACKKRRDGEKETEAVKSSEITEVLKFAGTIPTRDDSLSIKIRDAIRKEKLQKEYKRHDIIDIPVKARQSALKSSGKNRYQVITSRRAINLDLLDEREKEQKDLNNLSPDLSNKNKSISTETEDDKHKTNTHEKKCDTGQQTLSSKVFCLYDVENVEPKASISHQSPSSRDDELSQVTCNSVRMIRERVDQTEASSNKDDYVYDLYYTNRAGLDFRALETVLRIEAYGENTLHDDYREAEDDEAYEDDDDSNDEGNWRNDYPDEDPLYYENAEEGYLNEEDMNPNPLLMENGQRLEDNIASQLKIGDDELSSEDESNPYSEVGGQRSYESYLKGIKEFMK